MIIVGNDIVLNLLENFDLSLLDQIVITSVIFDYIIYCHFKLHGGHLMFLNVWSCRFWYLYKWFFPLIYNSYKKKKCISTDHKCPIIDHCPMKGYAFKPCTRWLDDGKSKIPWLTFIGTLPRTQGPRFENNLLERSLSWSLIHDLALLLTLSLSLENLCEWECKRVRRCTYESHFWLRTR